MKPQTRIPRLGRIAKITALTIVSGVTLAACNFNLSTATLENIKLCSQTIKGKPCDEDSQQFAKNIPQFIATADLKYAPEGTKITVDWKYLGGEAGQATVIDRLNLETKDNMTMITSSLPMPEKGWPSGDYEVVFSLDTDNAKPIHKKFSVVSSR
jgi:hypothetical protein